ncbi:MAG TPA: M15 family metallopeptidase [Pyrinomonadaceae bacterium]|nr:M15 family metallopeptidase [Pyrinomonadaceae bacterium]
MIELVDLDNTIKLDIRYATKDNFMGRPVYGQARAFLQPAAAERARRAHQKLGEKGLGIVVYDGYRPWSVTKLFWEFLPDDKRKFVADPARGSNHNRGCAIDLGLFELATGQSLPMPSGYDEFTRRASPDYTGGTDEERSNRDILRRIMEAEGFTVNAEEWWHFDLIGSERYHIYDLSFSEIPKH